MKLPFNLCKNTASLVVLQRYLEDMIQEVHGQIYPKYDDTAWYLSLS